MSHYRTWMRLAGYNATRFLIHQEVWARARGAEAAEETNRGSEKWRTEDKETNSEEEREGAGLQRGDRGGALMDRVKEEQTEERGGEGAVLGQWCVETNHLHLSSIWAECPRLVCVRERERESECDRSRETGFRSRIGHTVMGEVFFVRIFCFTSLQSS